MIIVVLGMVLSGPGHITRLPLASDWENEIELMWHFYNKNNM